MQDCRKYSLPAEAMKLHTCQNAKVVSFPIRKDGKFNTTVRFSKGQLELMKRPKGSRDDWIKVEDPKVENLTKAK